MFLIWMLGRERDKSRICIKPAGRALNSSSISYATRSDLTIKEAHHVALNKVVISRLALHSSVTLWPCFCTLFDVSQGNNRKHLLPRVGASRDVWVIAQLVDLPIYGQDGFVEFPMHTYLFVAGTSQDGTLKIEIATDNNNNNPYIRVKDFTTAGTTSSPVIRRIPEYCKDRPV